MGGREGILSIKMIIHGLLLNDDSNLVKILWHVDLILFFTTFSREAYHRNRPSLLLSKSDFLP